MQVERTKGQTPFKQANHTKTIPFDSFPWLSFRLLPILDCFFFAPARILHLIVSCPVRSDNLFMIIIFSPFLMRHTIDDGMEREKNNKILIFILHSDKECVCFFFFFFFYIMFWFDLKRRWSEWRVKKKHTHAPCELNWRCSFILISTFAIVFVKMHTHTHIISFNNTQFFTIFFSIPFIIILFLKRAKCA